MRKESLPLAFLVGSLLAVLACDDFSLYAPVYRAPSEVVLPNVSDGSIIQKGDLIAFWISAQEEQSLVLEVDLFRSGSDEGLWQARLSTSHELELGSIPLNESQEIELPEDLETGQYRLRFTLLLDLEVIDEKDLEFFYVEGDYEILAVESYPPVILPGSTGLLRAEVSYPEDSDPFLRWSQNEIMIAKGSISEGIDEIFWSAPDEVGVYSITVELFPIAPVDGAEGFSFASTSYMTSKLYVTLKGDVSLAELTPDDSYYTLMHFRGNTKDSGASAQLLWGDPQDRPTEPAPIGSPELVTVDDGFGFRLDSASGFRIPRMILPASDGMLLPFTISMGIEFDSVDPQAKILDLRAEDDSLALQIMLDERAVPQAIVRFGQETEIFLPSGMENLDTGIRYLVSLSVVPTEDTLTAQWFQDGFQTNVLVVGDTYAPQIGDIGQAIIGAEQGFAGVIDEFGVFFRDAQGRYATDPNVLSFALEYSYDTDLVYAEGFDGLYLPDDAVVDGDATVGSGVMALDAGSSLEFPPLELEAETIDIEIAFLAPIAKNAEVSFAWSPDTAPFVRIRTDGVAIVSETEQQLPLLFPEYNHSLSVQVAFEPDSSMRVFSFEHSEGFYDIVTDSAEADDLIIRITREEDSEEPIYVDRVIAVKRHFQQQVEDQSVHSE